MANNAKRGKKSMATAVDKLTREDSLIKGFEVVESDLKVYKNKIIFTTVKDVQLVYYTNTQSFMDLLEVYKGERFIITYEFARGVQSMIDGQRVIKVKLPKLPK